MSDAVIEHSNDEGVRTALGTLLIERGFLDEERLKEALSIGADTGERLGEVVVRMGWASEDDLARTLAEQWHLRYIDRSEISFDGDALSRMSREEATRLEALPMQISEDGAVVVALAEPTDARLLALRSLLGDRIDCVVVAKTAIDAGLRSDLLPKNGSSSSDTAEATEPVAGAGESHEEHQNHEATVWNTSHDVVETPPGEPATSGFDELAKTLSDGLSSQLASLRAIVVEAESARERDSLEIARLTGELSEQATELAGCTAQLAARNETIQSLQQKLRELADTLEHTS